MLAGRSAIEQALRDGAPHLSSTLQRVPHLLDSCPGMRLFDGVRACRLGSLCCHAASKDSSARLVQDAQLLQI